MKASVLSFQAAVIIVVVGMIWGLVMAKAKHPRVDCSQVGPSKALRSPAPR